MKILGRTVDAAVLLVRKTTLTDISFQLSSLSDRFILHWLCNILMIVRRSIEKTD